MVTRRPSASTSWTLTAVDGDLVTRRPDSLVTEEPLEMRLEGLHPSALVTMRTPGSDFELVAGWLVSEGVVIRRGDIRSIRYCVEPGAPQDFNVVSVTLGAVPGATPRSRSAFASSACGVCGKEQLADLTTRMAAPLSSGPVVAPDLVTSLPDSLRSHQRLFDFTGGLHAAALFAEDGTLEVAREDVGRHNAVDKVVGWALLADRLPLAGRIMMISGRVGFEIVQKCAMAGIPMLCAVSAPTSLAVQLAEACEMTIVGFVRQNRFNVYTSPQRVATELSQTGAVFWSQDA